MIAQARIASATRATVYLAESTVDLHGETVDEVRNQVKDVFITAARQNDAPLDVVIVEPGARHHLVVEPSGRITARPADDRPLYGPDASLPLGASAPSATTPGTQSASDAGHGAHGAGRRRASHSAASAMSAMSATSPAPAPSPSPAPESESTESAESVEAQRDRHDADATAETSATPATTSATPAGAASSTASASSSARDLPSAASLAADTAHRPTLQDLQNSARPQKAAPPTKGWQGWLARISGGNIAVRPNRAERRERDQLERVRRQLDGPKNIAVVNLKGGAHKTTASLMIAATLGVARGGSVLAWDNNETRGTLGWRGIPSNHTRTALDLLHDLDRFRGDRAYVADLDHYVRPQGDMRFDILASDEDPGSAASIDGDAFTLLDDTLSKFYRLKVIDTGNNVRASNWLAAVNTADQLVIISTVREDTFNAAAWMIDELRATGLAKQVDNAVTVLSQPAKGNMDAALRKRLVSHFGAHTRAVVEVPFEQQFVDGGHLDWPRVSDETKTAWLEATALIVDGL